MFKIIKITAANVEVLAELNNSRTAEAIWDKLPLKGLANIWGEEIYFSIPVILPSESGRKTVNLGDLGYWPQGNAFCIFFGPTPISNNGEIKPASAVNVFGKIIGDPAIFKQIKSGATIIISKSTNDFKQDTFSKIPGQP